MLNQKQKTVLITSLVAVLMFGFSFALIPLYKVLCEYTGISNRERVIVLQNNPQGHEITLQFVTTNNAEIPWEFYPKTNSITIHPNENGKMLFYAKNNSDHAMTVQAVPSFSPKEAANYFDKIECFCFRQQTLQAGKSKEMPVIFHVKKNIPENIQTITLGYTLFNV